MEAAPGALTGYRVLDLCDDKGVLCTKIMADLGADVIAIEPPGGAATRCCGPFYHDQVHPERSLFFWYFYANKRSITLHPETPDGQALFKALVKTADVLVETFPPGYLDRLGLGYADLRAFHPGLVMTSITGFGSTGPYCHYKAPDLVGLAMGGLMYLCGEPDGAPVPPGGQQGDHLAALNGVTGTLIALWHREITGEGQHVDAPRAEPFDLFMAALAALDRSNVGFRGNSARPLWADSAAPDAEPQRPVSDSKAARYGR